jgi:hypothetical protein
MVGRSQENFRVRRPPGRQSGRPQGGRDHEGMCWGARAEKRTSAIGPVERTVKQRSHVNLGSEANDNTSDEHRAACRRYASVGQSRWDPPRVGTAPLPRTRPTEDRSADLLRKAVSVGREAAVPPLVPTGLAQRSLRSRGAASRRAPNRPPYKLTQKTRLKASCAETARKKSPGAP